MPCKTSRIIALIAVCALPWHAEGAQNDPLAKGVVSNDAPIAIPEELRTGLRYRFQKRMAISGHGVLFDVEGRRVALDPSEIKPLQEELLTAARKGQPDRGVDRDGAVKLERYIARLSARPSAPQTDGTAAALQRHMLIVANAARLQDAERSAIVWRTDFILHNLLLRDWSLERLLRHTGLARDWASLREIIASLRERTPYMASCSAAGVPLPPDFSTTGTRWTRQGTLSQNLLNPGNIAEVWTAAPASGRGACVALPRRNGPSPTDAARLAGIICQSATTGNACFWDNIDRNTGARLPWDSQTLKISDLMDGSNLSENCTGCHKGNNVYLVAPDDPTWCRLLRGGRAGSGCSAPSGARAANLTLKVEAPVDTVNEPGTSIYHPRYRPLSGAPARPMWVNGAEPGCGGACHLRGAGPFTTPNPMAPNCGTACN